MRKAFILFVIGFLILVSCKKDSHIISSPPSIDPAPVTENYFGKEVTDEYRNLENMKDSIVIDWYKEQAEYAQKYITGISDRKRLQEQMKDVDNRKSFYIKRVNITEDDQYFYLKKKADEDSYKLYYRPSFKEEEELLFDPADFKPESGNEYHINYIKPSWEGNYVVVSLSHSGKEISEMIVVNMKTRKVLPQILSKAWPSSFLGVSWLPDSSGFIYLEFPITDPSDPAFKTNTRSVLYKLGDNPENVKDIFSAATNPDLVQSSKEYPIVELISKNDKYVIGHIATVDSFWDGYYAEVKDLESGKLEWKPFYKKEDKVYSRDVRFKGEEFIYKSGLNASNYNISSISMQTMNFSNPKILVEEKKDEVLNDFVLTSDGIYYTTSKNGVEALLYHLGNDSKSTLIELPKRAGDINLSNRGGKYPDIWVGMDGWTSSYRRYFYNLEDNTFISAEMTEIVPYKEFEDFVVEEVLVPSYDGVEVPLSIVYDKKLKRNGKNPVFFYGYGAYGSTIRPFFSPVFLTWVQNGGVLCIPHVRGGGEKGDAWHRAGYKATKPNTWKDLIACVEYTIDKGFTSKEHTAIYSASAGGIMIGRAMTERPDLFAVAIADVGVMNASREEFSAGGGGSNYREFGTMKDSVECMGLIAMDAYLHLKKGEKYPATFLTTGMNDPRVSPWTTGKFVAKLQAYTSSERPVLYRVDYEAGHGSVSEDKMYEEWADVFSFAFWQTGHKDFQYEERN